jgi:peroxiredoxin
LLKRLLVVFALLPCVTAHAGDMVPGSQAPSFTLKSLKEKNLSLREYRGQVIMVNFWATWCGPCRQEMPALNALYEKYRHAGFVLLGVNVDAEPANAARMVDRLKVTYPILFDREKKASLLYQVKAHDGSHRSRWKSSPYPERLSRRLRGQVSGAG